MLALDIFELLYLCDPFDFKVGDSMAQLP